MCPQLDDCSKLTEETKRYAADRARSIEKGKSLVRGMNRENSFRGVSSARLFFIFLATSFLCFHRASSLSLMPISSAASRGGGEGGARARASSSWDGLGLARQVLLLLVFLQIVIVAILAIATVFDKEEAHGGRARSETRRDREVRGGRMDKKKRKGKFFRAVTIVASDYHHVR